MIPVKGSRARVIAAAMLVLTFLAGAAVGVTANRLLTPAPTIRTRIVMDMSAVLDKLELTPEQRTRADSIILRRGPRAEEAMIDVAQRLRTVSDSADAELRAILTPAQGARLDSLRAKPRFKLLRKRPNSTRIDTVYSGKP